MARRERLYRGKSKKVGLPPGSLVYIGNSETEQSKLKGLVYSAESALEFSLDKIDQSVTSNQGITWINLDGLNDLELIQSFGDTFKLHSLVLEDIVNTTQRPKLEDYGDYLFVVARAVTFKPEHGVETGQVSIVIGKNFILSFQEGTNGDIFDGVRGRLLKGGRIRSMGVDYLAYALLDSIVDNYFTVLEDMGELVENIEEELAEGATQSVLKKIISLKREIIFMRKGVWPLREVIVAFERGESPLISSASHLFFRDIYDHTIQVIDGVETFRDLLAGMLDLYMSSMSNRTNEIMKFLTLVGTIFMPLTFIVGVYGMNFKFMPETEWHYGYFMIWGVMLVIATVMAIYFKRKRWM